MEDSDAIRKAKKLLERQNAVTSLDRADFKISKNIASGNGISEDAMKVWGKDRAIVNIPILDPAVNSICHRFDTNPFSFNAPPGAESLFDSKELAAVLSRSLREICWDGISYVFAYHSGGKVKFRVLDNLNVVYGKCKLSDGSDCREALYVDKISERDIKEQYPDFYIENGTIADYDGVARQEGEYEEVTYWERTESGVKASKIIGGRLAEESELPLTRLPIVRITGKKARTKHGENWRGVPYPVRNLLDTLTYCASLLQERIATAPNFSFWVAQESASDHETAQQMAQMNGWPRACGFFRAFADGRDHPLPVPMRVDKSAGIEELGAHIGSLTQTINMIVGSVSGSPPEAGTETAESVLLRRESKETATDEFLRNLLTGAQGIAALMKEFFAMLGMPVEEIAVSESIFEKAKQQSDSQKLAAYVGFLSQNPQSMDFAEVLLETLDLERESKERVQAVLIERKQREAQGIQQMQEQIQQGANMLMQAQGENQGLQQQLALAQKQLQDLQLMNFEMQSDSRARILIEEMKLKNQIVIKQMEIDFEREKLGFKADTDAAKIAIEAAKAENNAAKAENVADRNELAAAKLASDQMERIETASEEAQEHPTDGGFR